MKLKVDKIQTHHISIYKNCYKRNKINYLPRKNRVSIRNNDHLQICNTRFDLELNFNLR